MLGGPAGLIGEPGCRVLPCARAVEPSCLRDRRSPHRSRRSRPDLHNNYPPIGRKSRAQPIKDTPPTLPAPVRLDRLLVGNAAIRVQADPVEMQGIPRAATLARQQRPAILATTSSLARSRYVAGK